MESVLNQYYPDWELCIADDNSTNLEVKSILREYAAKDSRIKVVFRNQNGHISKASNSAIELLTGDYIAFLDHDDTLSPYALYYVAMLISTKPDVNIIYSDEDIMSESGKRLTPHFKSDYNLDLLLTHNYITHFCVYRRSLISYLGGLRIGYEGSQDYDLLLRAVSHIKHQGIYHIPMILYHWRAIEGSTALQAGEKSYTVSAGLKALRSYLDNNGHKNADVVPSSIDNFHRIFWPIPQPNPMVSLLIPARDKKEVTEVAVESIISKTTYKNYEIIILDNDSKEEETLEWLRVIEKKYANVRVLSFNYPFNYSAINNYGARNAKGSIIGLINNDIEVISPGWLTEMVSHCVRDGVGCVGAKLYYSNDTVQHGGVILGLGGLAAHSHRQSPRSSPGYFGRLTAVQNLSAVTGAVLLVRKEIFDEVGGLDEENLAIAYNDVDFCLKVRQAGYRIVWTPHAELY
ncbi:glycosyltransferase family 2 protein, partial [Acidithiobacillus caldus]|uniref:glycosyltransferase family 2 protein n=1 Tax=Acidithiobacillus caldus TaxID=33059 RepID=UPI001F5215B8